MTIDWGALAIVAVVSLAVGVLVVGLSARELSLTGEAADATVIGRARSMLSPAMGTVTAVLCLLGAAAIVLYGRSALSGYGPAANG